MRTIKNTTTILTITLLTGLMLVLNLALTFAPQILSVIQNFNFAENILEFSLSLINTPAMEAYRSGLPIPNSFARKLLILVEIVAIIGLITMSFHYGESVKNQYTNETAGYIMLGISQILTLSLITIITILIFA